MTWSRTSAGKFAASTISVALASSTPFVASIGMRASASGSLDGELLDLHAALHRGHGQEGAVGPVEQVGEVVLGSAMSLAWATITRWVMCPLMSSPRMSWARALASSGLSASFTPPALPRPPVFTCALTTTGAAISRAIASASLRRLGDTAGEHGNAVRGQQVTGLVLEEIHEQAP